MPQSNAVCRRKLEGEKRYNRGFSVREAATLEDKSNEPWYYILLDALESPFCKLLSQCVSYVSLPRLDRSFYFGHGFLQGFFVISILHLLPPFLSQVLQPI